MRHRDNAGKVRHAKTADFSIQGFKAGNVRYAFTYVWCVYVPVLQLHFLLRAGLRKLFLKSQIV